MKRLPALLAALAVVVAACGGSDDTGSAVASLSDVSTSVVGDDAAQEIDQEAAVMALTECLRENGVEVDDPTVDADGNVRIGEFRDFDPSQRGPDSPLGQAFEACQEHLEGVTRGFAGVDQTELQDTMLEFAACMRENGVDMPDPDFSSLGPGDGEREGPGQGGGPFGGLDLEDPVFQAAQEACGDILAGFGAGGGRFGGAPGGASNDG